MGRSLKNADHSVGKLDHLKIFISRPSLFSNFFYIGQSCVHGHTIRHKMHHWCLPCAEKIYKNICSFDINHIDMSHFGYYFNLFKDLPTTLDPSECWPMCRNRLPVNLDRPRFSLLTYRSSYIQRAESLMLAKLVYYLFWGDTGALTVKRLCKDPTCWNPFHLKSVFNNHPYTNKIDPFLTKVDTEKLNKYNIDIKQKIYQPILTTRDFI